jgi:hypothetical protein
MPSPNRNPNGWTGNPRAQHVVSMQLELSATKWLIQTNLVEHSGLLNALALVGGGNVAAGVATGRSWMLLPQLLGAFGVKISWHKT